jgi:dTDP-4-dehydrorhamnose reductase
MRYLITGANGQLAREFIRKLEGKNVYSFDREKLDISDERNLRETIDYVKPDIFINCAAYNNVDLAESEKEKSFSINSSALKNIALFSYKYKTKIIHFSTDYVFDGNKTELYRESDIPNPINIYGRSKLEGEKNLKSNYENYIIFRVSWVYGEGKQNFIYKLMNWAKNYRKLRISTDEISVPNSTSFIVNIVLKAIDNDLKGLWHLVSFGYVSRYEWAKKVFEILKIDIEIEKAKQNDFNLPAKRPHFSAMSNDNIRKVLGVDIKRWDEYLYDFLKSRKEIFL